jgi:1-acyl-sn-glycerol-3-phosphate acyltransferase
VVVVRALAQGFLRATGWRIVGAMPSVRKCVMIAAPHTSSWDFPYTIAIAAALRARIHFIGKQELFAGPAGRLFVALGGIPVDRSRRTQMVQAMVDEFARHEDFVLLVPAEGTRGRGEYWKSGFYRIAQGAGVPIALGFLDFARREGGIGPLVYPTGDLRRDMDVIRAFYAGKVGKRPGRFTPPRLREEDGGG